MRIFVAVLFVLTAALAGTPARAQSAENVEQAVTLGLKIFGAIVDEANRQREEEEAREASQPKHSPPPPKLAAAPKVKCDQTFCYPAGAPGDFPPGSQQALVAICSVYERQTGQRPASLQQYGSTKQCVQSLIQMASLNSNEFSEFDRSDAVAPAPVRQPVEQTTAPQLCNADCVTAVSNNKDTQSGRVEYHLVLKNSCDAPVSVSAYDNQQQVYTADIRPGVAVDYSCVDDPNRGLSCSGFKSFVSSCN